MEEKIEQLKKDKEKLTLELKQWVKDKSISLDKRWKIFFESDLGDDKTYYEDFVNFNSDDYCDNVNKYEVIDLYDVSNYKHFSQEEYDEFREDVLNKFIKSFQWDW